MKSLFQSQSFRNVFTIMSLFLILSTCGSDDSNSDNIDQSLLIDSYIEPYLNFLVDTETFLEDNGTPQESNPGVFVYNKDLDGIIGYYYSFFENLGVNPDGNVLAQSTIRANPNQHNFELLKNALTNIYGQPEFVPSTESETDFYFFPQTDVYRIQLTVGRDLNVPNATLQVGFVNYQ